VCLGKPGERRSTESSFWWWPDVRLAQNSSCYFRFRKGNSIFIQWENGCLVKAWKNQTDRKVKSYVVAKYVMVRNLKKMKSMRR